MGAKDREAEVIAALLDGIKARDDLAKTRDELAAVLCREAALKGEVAALRRDTNPGFFRWRSCLDPERPSGTLAMALREKDKKGVEPDRAPDVPVQIETDVMAEAQKLLDAIVGWATHFDVTLPTETLGEAIKVEAWKVIGAAIRAERKRCAQTAAAHAHHALWGETVGYGWPYSVGVAVPKVALLIEQAITNRPEPK